MADPSQLNFTEWDVSDGTSLSARVPSNAELCGIYVLRFRNGEKYVGQTVSLLSRIATHRRYHPDVVSVGFVPVDVADLNETERDVIHQLVAEGVLLRNRTLLTWSTHSAPLDLFGERSVTEEWRAGHIEPLVIGDRGRIAALRRRTAARYAQLTAHPLHDDVIDALALYVRRCIPWPHQTEGRFWYATSMPATTSSREWRRLAALTIQNVETLVIGEDKDPDEDGLDCFLNVSASRDLPEWVGEWASKGGYRSVGPVWNLPFFSVDELRDYLDDEDIADLARELALGLLRKGNGLAARHHNYHLADAVFERLDQACEGNKL